jgi:hypothetical protein
LYFIFYFRVKLLFLHKLHYFKLWQAFDSLVSSGKPIIISYNFYTGLIETRMYYFVMNVYQFKILNPLQTMKTTNLDNLQKVISGGQTGADTGALLAAKELGILTGGFAPKSFLTENGPAPFLKELNLVETSSSNYKVRTEMNVKASCLTVILSPKSSAGSNQTRRLCISNNISYLFIEDISNEEEVARKIIDIINLRKPKILNVAGNRESKFIGIQSITYRIFKLVFKSLQQNI